VVRPSPQHRSNGRRSGTSRKGYLERSVLGGEVGLVPVQLAGYLLVLEPVADRAAVGTGGRVATR
jgi:hypothetical protein